MYRPRKERGNWKRFTIRRMEQYNKFHYIQQVVIPCTILSLPGKHRFAVLCFVMKVATHRTNGSNNTQLMCPFKSTSKKQQHSRWDSELLRVGSDRKAAGFIGQSLFTAQVLRQGPHPCEMGQLNWLSG